MLDIKSLKGQFKTCKKVAPKDTSAKEKELVVFLRLKKELVTAADRIEARLKKSAKKPKGFAKWAVAAAVAHDAWLQSPAAPLRETRIGALLSAGLESSSSYNFGILTDFTAMMS